MVARQHGGGVSFEDDRRAREDRLLRSGLLEQLFQMSFAALLRKPDHLEEVVALGRAVGVVVDGFAGAREHARRDVVFAQDQVSIVLTALEGDAHCHLAQGAAGKGERAAQALRAEDDVDAEGSALADQAVEPQGGFLGELVFLAEELLEFVDDQEDARQGGRAGGVAVAGHVLHAGVAEPVGAEAELGIQPLEHADAEFALALDRDDARVGQLVGGVDLELDAFLEVDQVEVDLVGAVVQGEVDDQGVHERRLARAGAPGDRAHAEMFHDRA